MARGSRLEDHHDDERDLEWPGRLPGRWPRPHRHVHHRSRELDVWPCLLASTFDLRLRDSRRHKQLTRARCERSDPGPDDLSWWLDLLRWRAAGRDQLLLPIRGWKLALQDR